MFASDENATALTVAMIALAGVFIGSFWTSLTASRAVYIGAITAERSKWIERLRTNIAAYSTTLAKTSFRVGLFRSKLELKPDILPDQILSVMEELNQQVSVIQLQLNPAGIVDRNILALINSVVITRDTQSIYSTVPITR